MCMLERPEIIAPPRSPLDGIFDHYNDLDGDWKGDYFIDRHSKKRFRGQPWNVAEVERTSEIKDNFGYLRFKVYLYAVHSNSALSSDVGVPTSKYEVSTTSFMFNNEERTIFTSEQFASLRDAQKCYENNVKQYSMIARIETKHYEDIEIYADKIGYRRVDECCANCRWCQPKPFREDKDCSLEPVDGFGRRRPDGWPVPRVPGHHGRKRVVCTNYKLFAKRLSDIDDPDFDQAKIRPEVDPGCVCNAFEKKLPPNDPGFHNHCYDQYGNELKES